MNAYKGLLTIIMAGGRGERLFPLTRDKAKPAIIFGGIYRIIDFTLSNCLNSGIRRIYVLSQYGSFSLDQHLRLSWELVRPESAVGLSVLKGHSVYAAAKARRKQR